jgi:hypothetical protein
VASFFVNLKKHSYEFFEEHSTLPDAWLLSSHRATGSTLEIARQCAKRSLAMMADNGTIAFIRAHTERFADEAEPIARHYRSLRRGLPMSRHTPYQTEVPDDLRASARKLFSDLCEAVDEAFANIDPADQTYIQLQMDPTHVIAKEDWSVAVLLGLGIERELLGYATRQYVSRNRMSIAEATKLQSQADWQSRDIFATLAATDYTTAVAAGKEAAKAGIENVALGFAGLNADNSYTDTSYYPRRHRLKQPGPHRYVRLAEIMLGLRDAYRQAPTVLRKIHVLGLGSRIMWCIPAATLDDWTEISIDSTAPIKDAEGPAPIVYDPDTLDGRVPVSRLAGHWIEMGKLPFDSPILSRGLEVLQCDATRARRALEQMGESSPRHELLRTGNALADALPLFANGPGTTIAGHFLANHNFWASIRAADAIPEDGRREWALCQLRDVAGQADASVTVRNGAKAVLELLDR